MYDFLLFVHVLFAFAFVAAVTLFWSLVVGTRPGRESLTPNAAMWLGRAGAITVGIGSLGALVFGVWLAIDVDGYEIWDGWILASIILWAIAVPVGVIGGRYFERAARNPAGAVPLRRTGLQLQTTASTALLLILVLMIYKPGA